MTEYVFDNSLYQRELRAGRRVLRVPSHISVWPA